jgi:hypothetical protein
MDASSLADGMQMHDRLFSFLAHAGRMTPTMCARQAPDSDVLLENPGLY